MIKCQVCRDVGVAVFELEDGTEAQRICNEPDCEGAKGVHEEAENMTRLLSAISDYRDVNLTRSVNRLAMDRYRNRLFTEFDRYMKKLTVNQVAEPVPEKSSLISLT